MFKKSVIKKAGLEQKPKSAEFKTGLTVEKTYLLKMIAYRISHVKRCFDLISTNLSKYEKIVEIHGRRFLPV